MAKRANVPVVIRIRFKDGRLPQPSDWFAFIDRERTQYPERVFRKGDTCSIPNSWDRLMTVGPRTEKRVIQRLLKDPVVETAEVYLG